MPTVSLSGNDTVVIKDRVFNNVADGDYFTFTFPNELAAVKTGKNGNSIFALNATGAQAEATLRLIRGSSDDKYLGALLQQQLNGFASFVLLTGTFTKLAGDGQGNLTSDTYLMSGGMFSHQVDAKSNAEGDTDQSVSVYRFRFSNGERAIL